MDSANRLDGLTNLTAVAKGHYLNLSIIERIGSVLSLTGTIFIVVTFLCSEFFHKPINRLIFYASVGNLASNVATLISRSSIDLANLDGALCQAQAFLIQMFMPADVLWAFAMSLNVYFTFYWHYNAADLKGLEIYYIFVCYGLPFIPALSFLFISSAEKGRVYGDAILWCWIASDWNILRIATFYGIVWVAILFSLSIYIRAGKDIWIKWQQLRNNSAPLQYPIILVKDPFRSEPTGQVLVSHTIEVRSENLLGTNDLECPHRILPGILSQASADYAIEISAIPSNGLEPKCTTSSHNNPARRYATMEANRAIWSYTKVSALFFAAMMITWIPSSANRVYSFMYQGQINYTLHYISAFVLPLQGLWNAIIYATTSLEACRHNWSRIKEGKGLAIWIQAFKYSLKDFFNRAPRNPFLRETDSKNDLPNSNTISPYPSTADICHTD